MKKEYRERAEAVMAGSGKATFTELVIIAGFNPATDLRYGYWEGINIAGLDLRGFDFTGSDLSNVNFTGSKICGARFDLAHLNGSDLSLAADFNAYCEEWSKPIHIPSDDSLPNNVEFFDMPLSPRLTRNFNILGGIVFAVSAPLLQGNWANIKRMAKSQTIEMPETQSMLPVTKKQADETARFLTRLTGKPYFSSVGSMAKRPDVSAHLASCGITATSPRLIRMHMDCSL